MATIEQLVFGPAPGRDKGREVLGSSPGISRDCTQEIVRYCENWGAIPEEGVRRSALLCFQLETRLTALPGDLHVVIHVAQGLKPIFHAAVISRADFQEFDLNPFALAQENLFLSTWEAGEDLPRREVQPGVLAPLVSPPPGAADVGFADEAVRQMMANKRLLLPLERASNDSDRFLALVVAGLPRALRLDLRFASWAPSGTNSYTLAATYSENALYTSWQPFLMTSVFGQLNDGCEEYLEELKVHLRSGDLAGLEILSRDARIDLSRMTPGRGRKKPQALTATVDARTVKKAAQAKTPKTGGAKSSRNASSKRRPEAATAAGGPSQPRQRPRSRSRAFRRRPGSGMRRRFAVVLSLAVLTAGAYYLWTSGHWTRLPGVAGANLRLQTDTSHGVVDIATIYQGALQGLQTGAAGGTAALDAPERRRGLEMLHQAGQLLERQGQDFLSEADQTLSGDDLLGVQPAPASRLHERGRVLARELRRLALARVSIRDQVDWRDLADLESRDLEARFDSLLTQRHGQQSLEPSLVEVDHLLRSVDVRSRQVGGLARLQELLNREQWDAQWCRRCDAAIDDLGGVRQARARRLRDDAHTMVRLKRAEHATDLASLAYRDDYAAANQLTPMVANIVPDVHERAGRAGSGPALLKATSDYYLNLRRAADADATTTQRVAALQNLERNRALLFDTSVYGEHLGRLRFLLLEQLAAGGTEPDSLPGACFAGDDRQDHLDFLQARTDGTDAAGWRELAGTLRAPYLRRWATHRADALNAVSAQREAEFTDDLTALSDRLAGFRRTSGDDLVSLTSWRELLVAADGMCDRYRGAFADDSPRAVAYTHVVELTAALRRTPPLACSGVTVRLDQDLTDQPCNVVVELQLAAGEPLRSEPLRLGPAAPAGTGWVGSCSVDWRRETTAGTPLTVRVLDADDGGELGTVAAAAWLTELGPQDLGHLESSDGVRVACRLDGAYWSEMVLPELDGPPTW